MKKILLALDDSRGAKACVKACINLFASVPPEIVILLHVQQFGGPTVIHDRISDSELSTLSEDIQGSEFLKMLARKSNEILLSHRKELESHGITAIKTIIKSGHITEAILNTANEEEADMIIIGNTRNLVDKLMMGDITKGVLKKAQGVVLLAR